MNFGTHGWTPQYTICLSDPPGFVIVLVMVLFSNPRGEEVDKSQLL